MGCIAIKFSRFNDFIENLPKKCKGSGSHISTEYLKLLPLFSDDEELSESDIKPTQDQPLAVVWIYILGGAYRL